MIVRKDEQVNRVWCSAALCLDRVLTTKWIKENQVVVKTNLIFICKWKVCLRVVFLCLVDSSIQ